MTTSQAFNALAFDITEAIKHLREDHHKEFVEAVRRYHAVVSVSLDLKSAQADIEAFHHYEKDRALPYRSRVGASLLTNAVITYSRATHTKAISRYKVGILKCYSPTQKLVHASIVKLRDKCLAHFGPGEDRWHDERVICIDTPYATGVTSVHHRINFDMGVIAGLSDLLTSAIPFARTLEEARASEVSALFDLMSTDVRDVVRAHVFDVAGFYNDSEEAVERFWHDTGFSEEFDSDESI